METPPPQFVNYPRQGPGGGGPMGPSQYWRPPGVYFEAIGDAWRLVNEDLGTWIGATAIMLALNFGINIISRVIMFAGMMAQPQGREVDWTLPIIGIIIALIGAVLLTMLQPGMMFMAVKKARGMPITVMDMFAGFRRFFPELGTLFLYGLLATLGFLCCIVPGLYVMGAYSLAQIVAIDQDVDPVEAMKMSHRVLGKDTWLMFCLFFVASMLGTLGICACGVGYLFTFPVFAAVMGLHYHYYFPVDRSTPDVSYGYAPPGYPMG